MNVATNSDRQARPRDWKRKPKGEGIPYIGWVWCSNGAVTWLVEAVTTAQFVSADRVLYWMPADLPEPPNAAEIAAMEQEIV